MFTFIHHCSSVSKLRQSQLIEKIKQFYPSLFQLKVHEIYWVESQTPLTFNEQQQIFSIFNNQVFLFDFDHTQKPFIIAPRPGTISPWSSKTLELLQQAGLNHITSVQRGVYYLPFQAKNKYFLRTDLEHMGQLLADHMLETVLFPDDLACFFSMTPKAKLLTWIPYQEEGQIAIQKANQEMDLGLSSEEIIYLDSLYSKLKRNPTDAELMMFAVVNSEHCRHKIFNANWLLDQQQQPYSLFQMIQHTYKMHPEKVLLAYRDNAAILEGNWIERWMCDPITKRYITVQEPGHWVIKVETHNHPTAISPYPGAATGSGGEIRDEAATGRGAIPKAGLTGFSVSHLCIPEFTQGWEYSVGKPTQIASSLEIMLTAPLGSATFNNEFGRPNLCGYFRSFSKQNTHDNQCSVWGYHKPIMIAGGYGAIRPALLEKKSLPVKTQIIVLGGPALRIGLGGGSASSKSAGLASQELDFASVQRGNPEMERRCQEVINACIALNEHNPILSIHDVGAGGLSNAVPELVEACGRGAKINLRKIPTADSSLSPMELWCNEAQERYVLAIAPEHISLFEMITKRENCPFAIIGEVTEEQRFIVEDPLHKQNPVDLPMSALFNEFPRLTKMLKSRTIREKQEHLPTIELREVLYRVLKHPTVASKKFLITIGDRSVGGLVVRDQMVGPWQVPVADCAVTAKDFRGYEGEAMSVGERAPLAIYQPKASARIAAAEAIMNLIAADVPTLSDIKFSANWMAACSKDSECAALYEAVQTLALEFCPALGITIPVGKDSLSMQTQWVEAGQQKEVISPMTLIISAFANVGDIRLTWTPQLQDEPNTNLLLIDLANGQQRMGGSIFSEVYQLDLTDTPDVEDPIQLKSFFSAMQALRKQNLVLAYHDRSDGGLWTTLCEMMFASRLGMSVLLDDCGQELQKTLFNEEMGAVIQIRHRDLEKVQAIFNRFGLSDCVHTLGSVNQQAAIHIYHAGQLVVNESREDLERAWAEISYRMQSLRDHPDCAREEYELISINDDPGLNAALTFELEHANDLSFHISRKPKVAILRAQGVNGHYEMAAAFERVGFDAIDVHMNDLIHGHCTLSDFSGLAAVGGFSYGDVLGAGKGWAMLILKHPELIDMFQSFFANPNTFTLGVCNGCQMLSHLKGLIPGAEAWPVFKRNQSEQFEARLSMVEITPSPSIFMKNMWGSRVPIVVSHGEGFAFWSEPEKQQYVQQQGLVAMHYVDSKGISTERYPFNPNGSPQGMTAFSSQDGRALIMMPHPERIFRTIQFSWHPKNWGEYSPWLSLFANARRWLN